ncbi:MAG: acyl-CoA synthetase [Alphaproteobacteria bacterium]|nr:acyl-CoA synthetase [Alphaproteobacteria bacterium]
MAEPILVRTLADVEAIEAKPLSHLNLPQSTYHAIRDAAETYPGRTAFRHLRTGTAEEAPEDLNYRDLLTKLHQTANLLHELGVGAEDAVSLLLPIIPETSICLWAAAATGIANPVNSFLETGHLVSILRSGRAKVVIGCHPSIEPTSWARVQSIREQLPEIIAIQIGGDGSALDAGVIHYESAIAAQPGDGLISTRALHQGDVCAYLHTGGTTGQPKLARHSHRGQLLLCAGLDFLLGPQNPSIGLLGVPMFHVGGAIASSLYTLSRGGTIVTLSPIGLRDPAVVRDFLANAERFGATTLGGVPASWSALLTMPSEHLDLSKVRNGIVAASTLPLEVAHGVTEKFGFPLVEGWGMTETHCFATMNPLHGEIRVGSVGIRFPYMQVRVAQLDQDGQLLRDCATDEIGVLLVKGPQVIDGYVDAHHNRDAWVDGDWLNTGDLARMDRDGYLWHTGRAKDVIIRGGHNIDPLIIEEVLYQAPGIELAAAVGQPDRRVGELPVAFVQMRAGAAFDEEAIKDFVRERIQERAANPVAIHAVAEMSLTMVGKIFKPALRMEAARLVLQRELSAIADGQADVSVSVDADPTHGTLATISVAGGGESLADSLRQAVSGYPLHCEIILSR